MNNLYSTNISELKSNHTILIINTAIRVWKSLGFSNEVMSNKIDELQEKLDIANKSEFIAILKAYNNKEGNNVR